MQVVCKNLGFTPLLSLETLFLDTAPKHLRVVIYNTLRISNIEDFLVFVMPLRPIGLQKKNRFENVYGHSPFLQGIYISKEINWWLGGGGICQGNKDTLL